MDLPMTQTSPAEFQSDRRHTETDSTLSGAGHSRSSNLRTFRYYKVAIRLRRDPIMLCAVTIVSGTVPRVVETVRGGRAPKQARRAGTQGRRTGTQGKAPKAGPHAPKAGRHPRQAGRQRQTECELKKDTQTPTHPNAPHTRTPGNPNGYPHVRQNSWFQNFKALKIRSLKTQISPRDGSAFEIGVERDMA